MEETKERNMDLKSSQSDVRTDRIHKSRDTRIRAEKKKDNKERTNESHDQARDHKESYADIQRARYVEMQQQGGSHETESRKRATNHDRESSEPKTISDEIIKSGCYQVRPGERICRSYRLTGLCDDGSNCIFNHPTCKFFRRGFCKDGSACKFIHAKNNEAPRIPNSTMRQALSSNVKNLADFSHPKERDGAEPLPQGSRQHETEPAAYMPEEKKYNRSLSQISGGSYKEKEQRQAHDDPQEQRDISDGQRYFEMGRRDAQEIVQKHRQRDITESQRYFEMGRRDAQEIVQRHRQRESSDRQTRKSQESVQERRQRDITECQRYIEMGRRDVQEIVQQHRQRETSEAQEQTESSSMAAKRAEVLKSLQSVCKDGTDDIAAGYKRMGIEHGEGCQRVEAEEIVQEQRSRQNQ